MKKILVIIGLMVLAGCIAGNSIVSDNSVKPTGAVISTDNSSNGVDSGNMKSGVGVDTLGKLVEPLANAELRVTKKFFGTKVSPGNSPVMPERFSGYHTGVDFETTAAEADVDVNVMAICDGKILVSETASGYGGVLVEACKIDGQDDTVIYGHIKHASVQKKVGDALKAGESFAVLGKGYSSETDGERKHLHLGIHKGSVVNILGYVQNKADLDGWIDFESLQKN